MRHPVLRRWFSTGLALPLLLAFATLAWAAPPPGYYASVDATDATSLRPTLHAVIDDHLQIPYTSTSAIDTWDVLERADEDPDDPSAILDLYRNASYPKAGGGNPDYQREHAWPNSYGFPDEGAGNLPYSDCHALFLADGSYNASRGNNPYAFCGPTCSEKTTVANHGRGGGAGTYPGNSNWRTGSGPSGIWETWIGRRGDVARALFYLDVRYEGGHDGPTGAAEPDLVLTDDTGRIVTSGGENSQVAYMGRLSDLLAWHHQDPVDDLERRRNDTVFEFQGNRNPFIDHPEWADVLFAPPGGGDCTADAFTLCLAGGRFQVRATWRAPQGTSGPAHAQPLTADTGYLWFFQEDNVEAVIKVLDACSFSGRFWVFAAGLTDVEVEISVTDTATSGAPRVYRNPLGQPFAPILDTAAFATCDSARNTPPQAAFTWSCTGAGCSFVDRSSDADGEVVDWDWSFGDGHGAAVPDPFHRYSAAGSYGVTLRVADDEGATSATSATVPVTCVPRSTCCKVCTGSRACGNSCISLGFTCHQPPGCACDSFEVCG